MAPSDILDDLITEGAKYITPRHKPGDPVKRSPIESESIFIRHAFWLDHHHCTKCKSTIPTFDVLMEERSFKIGGGKHWLRAIGTPQLVAPVVYIRHHYLEGCIQCMNLNYPIAEEFNAPA